MNPVLERIFATGRVTNGETTFPLRANMDRSEGELIQRIFASARVKSVVEVGLAYGISTLYACAQVAENSGSNASYIAIDPNQESHWHNVGLHNLREAGYRFVEHIDKGSEVALPELMARGTKVDGVIVDGWHTFDHALVDCFYATRMLKLGGVLVLDDTQYPSLNRLARYLASYPCFRVVEVANVPLEARSALDEAMSSKSPDWRSLPMGCLGSAVAFQKIDHDRRGYDWWIEF